MDDPFTVDPVFPGKKHIVFYDFSLDSFDFESILPFFFCLNSGFLFLLVLVIFSFLVAVVLKENGLVSVNIFSRLSEFIGFYRVSYCILLWFTMIYCVLLCFTVFYWVLLCFTVFYCVLLGFTGFYWILLSFP